MTDSTRVLLADDHDLFRVGLASALAAYDDIEVVAQASGGRMAVRLAAELRPDVVLMDLRMPHLDGLEATGEILKADPAPRVVALTVAAGDADVAAAITAGASGYVIKDAPIDDVVSAIRAAVAGTAWLSPRAARAVLDRMRREYVEPGPAPKALDEELSPRELEVLELVARGLDNNRIAAELCISPRTAKNHVSNILSKLGVTNRIQAAVYWHRGLG
jgi:two-component system, NarL family, response regulator LiaR